MDNVEQSLVTDVKRRYSELISNGKRNEGRQRTLKTGAAKDKINGKRWRQRLKMREEGVMVGVS